MCLDCMREWISSIDPARDDTGEQSVQTPAHNTLIRHADIVTFFERLENCERRCSNTIPVTPHVAPGPARLRAARAAFETHLRAGGFDVGNNTWDHVRETSPEVVDLWLAVVNAVRRELLDAGDVTTGDCE